MRRTIARSALALTIAAACSTPTGPSAEDRFRALGYWSGTCDEDAPVVLRCGIIVHEGNSYRRGLNDGERGPVSLDSAVLNQKYVRWGFYLKPQRVQSKLCYFHTAVNDWLCNWVWASYTATGIVPESVDVGGYTADEGDWAAIVTFYWSGRHRVILHAESNGYAPIDDTVEVRIANDSAPTPPPPPPPPTPFAAVVAVDGQPVSTLRIASIRGVPTPVPK